MRNRTLRVITPAVGNVGVGEDNLMTYAVTANLMTFDGEGFQFRASGTIANNANAKRIRVKYGATTILDTGAAGIAISTAYDWVVTGEVIRTGAATQKCNATLVAGSTVAFADFATAAETLSTAITFKLTGEAVADNDISQETLTAQPIKSAN